MDHFVHLEVQSAYSFLWGSFSPHDLVARVSALGQKAVALTDYGLYGAVSFYRAARKAGVQPLIGARVRLADRSTITLLAMNRRGYENLCRLLSLGLQNGLLPQPEVTLKDLHRWSEGLICLAGGHGSPIRDCQAGDRSLRIRTWLAGLKTVFREPETLFVVLGADRPPGEYNPVDQARELAMELDLPLTASVNAVCLEPQDMAIHRILVDIQRHYHHRDIQPLSGLRHIARGAEVAGRLSYPEALANTSRIAELCRSFELPVGGIRPLRLFPRALPRLAEICHRELENRYRPVPPEYRRRLIRELAVIGRRDLADYFLLVRQVVQYAMENNIRHSVRGSSAGSLIVHLILGGVDPLAHELLFERFINEGRLDMPDVDLDFDSEYRDKVIHHLMDRFPGQTAMAATVHTMNVRSAVRLAARAMEYPLDEISSLAACLPLSLGGLSLAEALETLPELKLSPLKREKNLVENASRITGLPFQPSVHLGGVLVAPDNILDWTPVGLSPKGFPVGQLDKDDVEALGLLKLDILGLRMHTAIRKSLEVLEGRGVSLQPERLSLDDPATYALLDSTRSLGVFQVESPGQRLLLGRLQPRSFSDLIAEISLFRPGPVEGNMVDPFVRRKNGEESIPFDHPDLVPILLETYGVILFQEQVLRIVHRFVGLPYEKADEFRRVMTKTRGREEMARLKEQFINGAVANGHALDLAEKVYRGILALAAYGFCKAHAASFAHITYQSAYLKAHYPQAFYLGLLNAGQVGSYPASTLLGEARRRGIPVLAPHVNSSGTNYLAEGEGIRVPLTVINGLGVQTARRIERERQRVGDYTDITDFRRRVRLPARLQASLTLAGALDGMVPAGLEPASSERETIPAAGLFSTAMTA